MRSCALMQTQSILPAARYKVESSMTGTVPEIPLLSKVQISDMKTTPQTSLGHSSYSDMLRMIYALSLKLLMYSDLTTMLKIYHYSTLPNLCLP